MAIEQQFVSPKSLEKVIVDTTLMEKNISHPTDAKLYHRAREKIVKWCEKEKVLVSLRSKTWCHSKCFRMLKRRQAIKAHLGHMTEGGKLRRNFLKALLAIKWMPFYVE
jgi:hypothetical protein